MKTVFAYDPVQAVAHLQKNDPVLGQLIRQVGPFAMESRRYRSLFEAMMRSIVYQQLHGKAAATILQRVHNELKSFGGPTVAALEKCPDENLRRAGLSRNKLLAIRDLAAKCSQGTVPSLKEAAKLSDEELVLRLTEVRGIGPWTVHMLLIFVLGRPDVLPTGDYAVRLAFKNLYKKRGTPSPALMIRHAKAWQPYRSVASWYLWRSLDTATP